MYNAAIFSKKFVLLTEKSFFQVSRLRWRSQPYIPFSPTACTYDCVNGLSNFQESCFHRSRTWISSIDFQTGFTWQESTNGNKKRRKQGMGNQSTSNCNTAQLSLRRIQLCRRVVTRKERSNSCRAVTDMFISASVLLCVAFVFVLIIANVAPNSSVQDEGIACFDMAASIPGLQSISGNHLIGTSKFIVPLNYFIHWFMLRMHIK